MRCKRNPDRAMHVTEAEDLLQVSDFEDELQVQLDDFVDGYWWRRDGSELLAILRQHPGRFRFDDSFLRVWNFTAHGRRLYLRPLTPTNAVNLRRREALFYALVA